MKKYTTDQRELLLSFLRECPDRQFSIEEIADQICESKDISISTIYRNINKLVEEENVRRFAKEGSRRFLYQYVGNNECCEYLHMQCSICGQIFHMDLESMNILLTSMLKNNFTIDKAKSILYGVCVNCR